MKSSFYNFDLASIHDISFDSFAKNASKYILPLLENLKNKHLPIIDLGSGTGIFSEILVENNYHVIGVDISEDMIRVAEKKVPSGQFRVGSLWDYNFPPSCAVLSIGECFNYLSDRQISLKDLYTLFARISVSLDLGGILIFDALCERDSMEEMRSVSVYEGDNWKINIERTEYGQVIEREIHIEKRNKYGFKYTTEFHVQKRYHEGLMVEILEYCGFTVNIRNDYGTAFNDPFHRVFTCIKSHEPGLVDDE